MASSPPAPYSANLPNTKKRPSISSSISQPATNKRPKLHPLRQTSFPANGDPHNYGPAAVSARSETGSVVNSTFSSVSATKPAPRGRGRPRKSLQVTDDDAQAVRDGVGTTSGRNAQAKSVVSAVRSGVGGNADEDIEEEEEEEMQGHEGDDRDADEFKQEEERRNILVNQLSQAQSNRYQAYRLSKLKPAVVRRIVNQTVSQSVASSQIDAVQFFSKAFAIEIIERARDVQAEWAKAADVTIAAQKEEHKHKLRDKEKALEDSEQAAQKQDPPTTILEQGKRAMEQEVRKLKDASEKYIANKHKGGLLPDHLREALRRYKADGDGNGFGFDGLSHPLLGVQGANSWRVGDGSSGQRLFR